MNDAVTIRRASREDQPYFLMRRASAQDRESLSYEAIGMLAYLLSKPDDWKIQPIELQTKRTGRDKIYRIIKELIDAKYLIRIWERDKGEFHGSDYILYEAPFTPLPDTVKPFTANPQLHNTDQDSLQNTDSMSSSPDAQKVQDEAVKENRKRRIDADLNDAIATKVLNQPQSALTTLWEKKPNGKLKNYAAQLVNDLRLEIVSYEKASRNTDKLTADDYDEITGNIEKMLGWYAATNPKMSKPSKGFGVWYGKWIEAGRPGSKKYTSEEAAAADDPEQDDFLTRQLHRWGDDDGQG